MGREHLSSRFGVILLSAGCAVGLGNVWRFPYIAGKNGGGLFVLLYLVFLAILGLPVLIMEFAAGRAAGRPILSLHSSLTPGKPAWRLHGFAGLAGNVVLMMFYTVVAGWMLIYFVRTASGFFSPLDPSGVAAAFAGMLASPAEQIAAMVLVCAVSAAVCAMGLRRGVERVVKRLMVCLLLLIAVLAANSIWLDARDGDAAGLRFYLVPSLERMREAGFATVVAEAMNHSFFTLSLGIGAMAIFGSYIGRSRTLLGEAMNVAALDTLVSIAAGIVVIPACFAYGANPGQGPGLVFSTLPNVFNDMPYGRFWGALFFAFMSCAAMTSVIAVFETILACAMDAFSWSRPKAGAAVGAALAVLSLPCILGFSAWSGFRPFGEGSCVLDLEDFVVSNLLLPAGSLCFILYATRRFGWGWSNFLAEANSGAGPKMPGALRWYCAVVLPLIVIAVFVLGLADRFGGGG
ncbi:MAG: sodium-dependent transporter [Kiritimatiellae bacterium]|nr:sodium-dependent transporter [Kiritimatiellia bacterium]